MMKPVIRLGIEIELNKFSTFTILSINNKTTVSSNTAPKVNDVRLKGRTVLGNTMTLHYTYLDAEQDREGETLIRWYRSAYPDGADRQRIKGADQPTITLTREDIGKYIIAEIRPRAATGDRIGSKVTVISKTPVTKTKIYYALVKTGLIGDKEDIEKFAGIIEENNENVIVEIMKEGKYYRIYLDFIGTYNRKKYGYQISQQ